MSRTYNPSARPSARASAPQRHVQAGFSMLEVLVSMLVLLLGLLGLAGLQAKAQSAELESYQRAQALVLLQDMVDRMNVNRKDAHDKNYDALAVGVGTTVDDCTAKTGWDRDKCEWNALLHGAAEAANAASVGAMVGARGCISYDNTELTDSKGVTLPGTGVYTITVTWQGVTPTIAPPSTLACGKNAYGNEALRRVASSTLRIGALGAL